MRPYADYVRASDLIQVSLRVGGLTGFYNPLALWGFSENDLGVGLQRHNLFLNVVDQTQWGELLGGLVTVNVGPITDFAHLADVADAVAQTFGEMGFSTSSQRAAFLFQVPDDITSDETAQFSSRARSVDFSAGQDTPVDWLGNFPGNLKSGVQKAIDEASTPGWSWLVIAGIVAAVLVVVAKK